MFLEYMRSRRKFSLQSERPLSEYYSTLKNLWDQLMQYCPFTIDLEQHKRRWEEFMIVSLLFGLDSDPCGFKDQILASETLPATTNAHSRLFRSSLRQHSTVTSLKPSALVSSNGGHSSSHDGFHGGHGSRGSHGGSRDGGCTSEHGDKKYDHCGRTNHTEPYCWVKYSKPNHVHQVIDGTTQSQHTYTSSRHIASGSDSPDALTSHHST